MVLSLINEPLELIQSWLYRYIFCGLTPVGRFQIEWVSFQAKFILEIRQGPGCTPAQKILHAKEVQITFQGSQWVYCQNTLCYVYKTLTQPCLSFSRKWWTVKNKSLFQSFSLKKIIIIIKWWQAFWDPCQINLLNLLNHGCEQQIQKQKSFIHLASICCPLIFCRNEKKQH